LSSATLIPERQFRSALIARAYYYESLDSVAPWRVHIAELNRERAGRLEPPIMEHLAAAGYRLASGEHLELPRALSVLFWLVGGVLLYRLALRLMPAEGALAATACYLFNPTGVRASVSFVPDPLMIGLFVATLFATVRWFDQPTPPRLAGATALAALTNLVKPLCLFGIIGAFTALALQRRGSLRRVLDRPSLLFLGGALLPAMAYYGHGVLIDAGPAQPSGGVTAWDTVARQWSVTFDPRLLLTPGYWQGWLLTAVNAMGPAPLVAGLLGACLARREIGRPLFLGLLVGYVVFCLVFTYHVAFAGYYHLQLLVVVALGAGHLAAVVMQQLRTAIRVRWLWALPALAAFLIAVPTLRAIRVAVTPAPIESAKVGRQIGELIHHSDRAVSVATFYGEPLQYFGEFYGTWWPKAEEDVAITGLPRRRFSLEQRLQALPFDPEYFVITDRRRYEVNHADLKAFLEASCDVIAERAAFLIYGRCAARATDPR
jgi:hypothetical protein